MTNAEIVNRLFDMRRKASAKKAITELCRLTNERIYAGTYTVLATQTDTIKKDCFDEWYTDTIEERYYIDFGREDIDRVIAAAVLYVLEQLDHKGLIIEHDGEREQRGLVEFDDRLTGDKIRQQSYVQKLKLDCIGEEDFYESFTEAFKRVRALGKKELSIW